jgi:hypothetical protein
MRYHRGIPWNILCIRDGCVKAFPRGKARGWEIDMKLFRAPRPVLASVLGLAVLAAVPARGDDLFRLFRTTEIGGEHLAAAGGFLVAASGGRIEVIDVSILSVPRPVGSLDLAEGMEWFQIEALDAEGSRIAASGRFPGGLIAFFADIDDAGSPHRLGSWTIPDALTLGFHGAALWGGYAIILAGNAGLHVLDLSDPASPVEVASLPVPEALSAAIEIAGSLAFVGSMGVGPEGGLTGTRGIEVVDISDPRAPAIIGSLDLPGDESYRIMLAARGRYLYAGSEYGIRVIDVGNPRNPVNITPSPIGGSTESMALRGSELLAANYAGIARFDLSDPAAPREAGFTNFDFGVWSLAIQGESLFAIGAGGFAGFSFSEPPFISNVACTSAERTRLRAWWGPTSFPQVEVQVDGAPVAVVEGSTGSFTTDPLADGSHTMCLIGIDGETRSWPACCGELPVLPDKPREPFIRGDTNGDGTISISDIADNLCYIFMFCLEISCAEARDVNDNGTIDLTDLVSILQYLYMGGPIFPEPFPLAGVDPDLETLGCAKAIGPPPVVDVDFAVEVGTVEGFPGETVMVPVFATTPVDTNAVSLALSVEREKVRIEEVTREGTILASLRYEASALQVQPDGSQAVLGLAVDLRGATRIPPLANEIIFYLRVHILEDAPEGDTPIVLVESAGDPPVRNEFSQMGTAVYATYPTRTEGRVRIGPPPNLDIFRGDANGDAQVDIADPIGTLDFLFLGAPPPDCLDAADADDSGVLDLSDAVGVLGFLFLGFPSVLPAPFGACGMDATPDALGCRTGGCPTVPGAR